MGHNSFSYRTSWVRSFQPYNISLTVRQLQASLRMNQPMPTECFNMGVRLLAYKENKRLTSAKVMVSKHYMDLRFSVSKLFLLYKYTLVHFLN